MRSLAAHRIIAFGQSLLSSLRKTFEGITQNLTSYIGYPFKGYLWQFIAKALPLGCYPMRSKG